MNESETIQETETTEEDDSDLPVVKIVLIGGASAGKSALLRRIVGEPFSVDYAATLGVDFRTIKITHASQTCKLQLWDTAGQERWRSIAVQYYRNAQGALLCYDVTSRASFLSAAEYLGVLNTTAPRNITIVLVACKCDSPPNKVAVSKLEAQTYASQEGIVFLETSSLTGKNIEKVIPTLLSGNSALKMLPSSPPPTPGRASTMIKKGPILRLGSCSDLPMTSMTFNAVGSNEDVFISSTFAFANRISSSSSSTIQQPSEVVFLLPFRNIMTSNEVIVSSVSVTIDGKPTRPLIITRKQQSDNKIIIVNDNETTSITTNGRFLGGVEKELLETPTSFICLSCSVMTIQWQQIVINLTYSTQFTFIEDHGGSFLLSIPLPIPHNKSTLSGVEFGATASGRIELRVSGGIHIKSAECLTFEQNIRSDVQSSGTIASVSLDRCILSQGINNLEVLFAIIGSSIAHWSASRALQGKLAVFVSFIHSIPSPLRLTPATILAPSTVKVIPEYFLVLDRSGSMLGTKWDQARRLTQLFLHSLPIGCRFQVIGFGTSYELALMQQSEEYNDETLLQAAVTTSRWMADLGGTELLEPLSKALSSVEIDKVEAVIREPRVLLVTDGNVMNTNEVVELVRQKNSRARVCCVGVGSDVDKELVQQISNAGKGTCVFVSGDANERLEGPSIKQLLRLMGLELTDIQCNWGKMEKTQGFISGLNSKVSAFQGEIVGFHAIVPQGEIPLEGCNVNITANLSGEQQHWEVILTNSGNADFQICNALSVFAASSSINSNNHSSCNEEQQIAKDYNVCKEPFGFIQQEIQSQEELRRFCNATIEQIDFRELRSICGPPPAHVCSTGEHTEGILSKTRQQQLNATSTSQVFSINSPTSSTSTAMSRKGKRIPQRKKQSSSCTCGKSDINPKPTTTTTKFQTRVIPGQQPYVKRGEGLRTELDLLIASQKCSGCWEPCGLLSCGIDLDDAPPPPAELLLLNQLNLPKAEVHALWATSIAVALCEGKLISLNNEWCQLIKKARNWINEHLNNKTHTTETTATTSPSKLICSAKSWLNQNTKLQSDY